MANNVLDGIAEQLEIQLPPSMIEDEYEHRYEEFINMLENSGLNLESYASQVQNHQMSPNRDSRECDKILEALLCAGVFEERHGHRGRGSRGK